jgi:rhodanese-related sulfurtransferase
MRNSGTPSLTPREAFDLIVNQTNETWLVDVRTDAEWTWVGTPILPSNTSSGKPHLIFESLKVFPDMHVNPEFGKNVYEALKSFPNFRPESSNVIFMCCCGGRSVTATEIMRKEPWNLKNAYSMQYGFAGDLNEKKQRGRKNGWMFEQFPWHQQ